MIFVFSLENEISFQAVYSHYAKMAQYRDTKEIPLILVGTQGQWLLFFASVCVARCVCECVCVCVCVCVRACVHVGVGLEPCLELVFVLGQAQ